MKFKKTILFIVFLILIILASRLIDTYSAKYLDSRYLRENGIIKGTEEIYIENGEEAILVLHGLTANPGSVKEIAEFLASQGYTVYAPVIKGHGTSVFDLEKTTYLDWKKSAEDSYFKLARNHKKIYLIGTSLGGLLSLDLATHHEIQGLIIINTPMGLTSNFAEVIPLIYLVNPYIIRGSFTQEELPIAVELKLYDSLPVKSIAQLKSYIEYVKPKLEKVNSSILVIQSVKDDTVELGSEIFILNNVISKKKDLLLLKNSTHINIARDDRELLKERVNKFLKEVKNV